MFADPEKTAARRLRRRLKAGLSIAVAVVAGTWLACKPGTTNPGPSPQGPDAREGPAPRSGSAPPPPPPDPQTDPTDDASASDAAADGGATDSAIVEAGREVGIARRRTARQPQVDRHEHRNGMPVRDNLLE
jgi:hypothetical protein